MRPMPATRRRSPGQPRLALMLIVVLVTMILAGCAGRELATRDGDGDGRGLSMERALILASARRALGTPYRYGGATADGLDCSGLVLATYRAAGISVPRSANQQYRQLPRVREARPGDLLFFGSGRRATHVGIYAGDRQMIHAPGRGRRVVSTPLDIDYWQQRFLGAAGPAP